MRKASPRSSWTAVELAILAALPGRGRDLARLRVLVDQSPPPTVTVIGKYNHGKSRLLNELIGSPVFSVADRRETVTLADHDGDGTCWLDSPGLDADVGSDDDRLAEQAAWIRSDIRLFVHAAREEQARSALERQQAAQRQAFDRDLDEVLAKVGGELRALVDVPGPDIALEPDSFENLFRITPAKLERARLQVAYSRACIAINAVLTGHGVVGLPAAQRTRVASLDTVIVAVLGVSVKFRDDLRRLFCEPAGRQGLAAAFARYFEQSDDRRALAQRIAEHDAAIAVADEALSAVQALIARAERSDD
ncbi:MAG: 50S ribosome-binding GTPase [Burkholderiaceae bacterium]